MFEWIDGGAQVTGIVQSRINVSRRGGNTSAPRTNARAPRTLRENDIDS